MEKSPSCEAKPLIGSETWNRPGSFETRGQSSLLSPSTATRNGSGRSCNRCGKGPTVW